MQPEPFPFLFIHFLVYTFTSSKRVFKILRTCIPLTVHHNKSICSMTGETGEMTHGQYISGVGDLNGRGRNRDVVQKDVTQKEPQQVPEVSEQQRQDSEQDPQKDVPQETELNEEVPRLHTFRSDTEVAKKSFRKHIELIQGEILYKNTDIIADDTNTITLTKFNKIGGHSIIYKYEKYVIKELAEESQLYKLISEKYPHLNKVLPNYYGTITLRIDDKRQRDNGKDNGKDYIILEDLTYKMVEPFVIDLKMGTRQYGLKSSIEKIKSQKLKCKNSTSLKLGVRLCGLQTINSKGKFQLYDKYYGRQLNPQEFLNSLVRFLNNKDEYHLLMKCLMILKSLRKVYNMINELDHFRFYGSSILMIYDNLNDFDVIIKLIDFSKSFITETDTESHTESDRADSHTESDRTDSHVENDRTDSHPEGTESDRRSNRDDTSPIKNDRPIDKKGKDYGYLKGIFNLIEFFKLIFETISKLKYNDNEMELMDTIKKNQHNHMKQWNQFIELQITDYEYDDLVSE